MGVERKQAEFTEFYLASRDACLQAVVAAGESPGSAEDIVEEAFARAWASWRTVRQHPVPRAWVLRTALNTRVSWWRPRRRETPLASYDAAAPAGVGGDPGGPGDGVDAAILAAL